MIIMLPSLRGSFLSAKPPNLNIKTAEDRVPIAYIVPQIVWLIANSSLIAPAKIAIKKVCPKEDEKYKSVVINSHLEFWI